MPRELDSIIQTSLSADVARPIYAVRLEFQTGTLRMWTGLGDLNYNGEVYEGVGSLLSISQIEETSELAVRGATLELSGINSTIISRALTDKYQGRRASIFFGFRQQEAFVLKESEDFLLLESGDKIQVENQTGALLDTALIEIFTGYMDQMSITESPQTSVVQLSLESKLINLERPKVQRYTEKWLKSKYPLDEGLSFIEDIQTREFDWGT